MCNFTHTSLEASEKEKQSEVYAGDMLIKRCDWNVDQDIVSLIKEGVVLIIQVTMRSSIYNSTEKAKEIEMEGGPAHCGLSVLSFSGSIYSQHWQKAKKQLCIFSWACQIRNRLLRLINEPQTLAKTNCQQQP